MRGTPVRFLDFTGGLNNTDTAFLVAQNECRDCSNVISTTRGSIKKRNGSTSLAATTAFTSINAGATRIQALYPTQLVPTAGTVLIAGDEDGNVYTISTGGTVSDVLVTPATLGGNSKEWMFAQGITSTQGPVYMLTGSGAAAAWVGSGTTWSWTATSGTLPLGKFLVWAKSRMYIANVSGFGYRLFWSDLDNPRSWPAANVVDFDTDDGQPITALGTVGPYLLVFKRDKVYVVYDFDSGANRVLSRSVGAISQRSVVETPYGTVFLTDDDGIYITNGKTLEKISQKVDSTLNSIVTSQRQYAAAGYRADHYYISVCTSGTENNITLDYDFLSKSWWKHTYACAQWANWQPANQMFLYGAESNVLRVSQAFADGVNQDSGTNFQYQWVGPWLTVSGIFRRLYISEPYRNKRIRQLHFDGSGAVDIYVAKNYAGGGGTLIGTDIFSSSTGTNTYGGTGSFGGTGIYGDSPGQARDRIFSQGVARAFSIIMQGTSSTTAEVDAYTVFITQRQN